MTLSDIFREVEEEVRRERFEQIWKQYGDYIIAGVALVVIAVAGYELWLRYEANQKLKASETFIAAQQLADSGNVNQASAAFAVIAKDAPDGYAKLARLSQAGVLEIGGQRSEALAIFKSIAKDDDGLIGSVARLRGGWILAADGPRADLDQLIAPLTDPASPWRFSAREILAYADYHAGQTAKAQAEFQSLGNDKDASITLRRRCSAMAMFLKNGGMANYGKVPPPAQPAPTPATVTAPAP
jgi:hypothetical protein